MTSYSHLLPPNSGTPMPLLIFADTRHSNGTQTYTQARYATHKIEKHKRNKQRKTTIRLYTNDDENSQLYQEKYRKTKRDVKYKINTIFFSNFTPTCGACIHYPVSDPGSVWKLGIKVNCSSSCRKWKERTSLNCPEGWRRGCSRIASP